MRQNTHTHTQILPHWCSKSTQTHTRTKTCSGRKNALRCSSATAVPRILVFTTQPPSPFTKQIHRVRYRYGYFHNVQNFLGTHHRVSNSIPIHQNVAIHNERLYVIPILLQISLPICLYFYEVGIFIDTIILCSKFPLAVHTSKC